MKILIVDNYDSFTYNLAHIVQDITGKKPKVIRNDKINIEDINKYHLLILSPGPGMPNEAGILKKIIKTYAKTKPIFGVCLGLQAIVEVFGGKLENLKEVFHGVATPIQVLCKTSKIYKNIPHTFKVARYHSWVASYENFPKDLEITAIDQQKNIMSLRHKNYNISAVQYHPESILTPLGKQILKNFIVANT